LGEGRVRVLSQRERKQKRRTVRIAGIAGQSALGGSQIKPPALPEVHDNHLYWLGDLVV